VCIGRGSMRGECAVANWRSGVWESVSLWDGIAVTLCYSRCDATEAFGSSRAQGVQHRAHVQARVFLVSYSLVYGN
jgi:hypothetical protein